MENNKEFPQYYHVEDLYGNVFAVVCREHETLFTVIQKRDVRKSFIVSKVSNEAAVRELAPGQMLGASAHDYEEVLTKEFGFSLSNDVICYYPEPEENANVEEVSPDRSGGSSADGNKGSDPEIEPTSSTDDQQEDSCTDAKSANR